MSFSRGKRTRGYRSKLESRVASRLNRLKMPFTYESGSYGYVLEKEYTPDFFLPDGTVLEVKGVLMPDDRSKMIAVRKAYPDLPIVFVFQKPHSKVPRLKSTHAEWAEKQGFAWVSADTFKKRDLNAKRV